MTLAYPLAYPLATPLARALAAARHGESTSDPIPALSPVRYFKLNTGITQAGGFASVWDDFIIPGAGRGLLQAVATNQPAVDGAGLFTFDGIDNFMKCTAFTLNQPCTVVLRAKQVTWTSDYFFDGNTSDTMAMYQASASPIIRIYAGAGATLNGGLAVNTIGAVRAVFNGASSSTTVNGNAAQTGDAGLLNAGGFALGSTGSGLASFSRILVMDAVLFSGVVDDTTFNIMRTYWGL